MSRPQKTFDHEELRRSVINASYERPITFSMLADQCCCFSISGRHTLNTILLAMLKSGDIETWDGAYCYMKELGGTPMKIV